MVAASMFCVLAGSTAWAEPGALPGESETLKRVAQEVIPDNQELRIRDREPETAMTKQEQAVKEEAKEAAKQKKIQLGGAIELGVGWRRNFARVAGSELTLESAEFDFEAKLIDWAKATLAIEWDSAADKLTVNEAFFIIEIPEKTPLYLKAGRGIVPFGISSGSTVAARLEDKLTVTEPLTIEVFDAKEDHVLLGVKTHGFDAAAYVFNGTTNRRGPAGEKRLEHYGATVSYGMKTRTMSFAAGINAIDSVFDSDALTEAFPAAQTSRRYAPGIGSYVKFGLGGFSIVASYNAAIRETAFTRNKKAVRIQPAAWHIEGGYTTEMFGKKTFGALSYSQTHELAGAFPETRKIATVGAWLSDEIRLAVDYAHDEDYARAVGGTGRPGDAFTLRLTVEW